MDKLASAPDFQSHSDLPRVDGQHRNRALAAERRRRCVEFSLQGWTYQQIAEELGYDNRGTVYRLVQTALRGQEVESIHKLRDLEVARLDELQAAWWDRALSGDAQAAMLAFRIIDRRCKILGMYAPDRHSPSMRARVVSPADLLPAKSREQVAF